MNRLPAPSTAISLLALFVSLGGTGYAALKLPRNSVGAQQIKTNAVRSPEIKNGAVRSADVGDGSLLANDFAPGQLPSGARGPAGANGRPGPRGLQGETGDRGPAGPSTGPAGGALAGSYPDPSLAPGAVGPSAFATLPGARAKQERTAGAGQTFPTNTSTTVEFDTETYDNGDMYPAGDDTMTVPVTGTYLLAGEIHWDTSGVGFRRLSIEGGGSKLATALEPPQTSTTGQTVSTLARLNAGDVVGLEGSQGSGGDLKTISSTNVGNASLAIQWVAP